MTKHDIVILIEMALESQRIAADAYHHSDLAAMEFHKLSREIEVLRAELRKEMLEGTISIKLHSS